MPKQWIDWPEQCDNCGGDTQVLTDLSREVPEEYDNGYDHWAWDGDLVRCRDCYCLGMIVDYEGEAYIEWPDDFCAKCHRFLEGIMDPYPKKGIHTGLNWPTISPSASGIYPVRRDPWTQAISSSVIETARSRFIAGESIESLCHDYELSPEQIEQAIRAGFHTSDYLHIGTDGVTFTDAERESCCIVDYALDSGERVLALGLNADELTLARSHAWLLRAVLNYWLYYGKLPESREQMAYHGFVVNDHVA